jgi:hypothetical protein
MTSEILDVMLFEVSAGWVSGLALAGEPSGRRYSR